MLLYYSRILTHLCYHVQTNDVYADMLNDDMYDTSDYPVDHPLHSLKNKKVLGKFKDECNGKPLLNLLGLDPKCILLILVKVVK